MNGNPLDDRHRLEREFWEAIDASRPGQPVQLPGESGFPVPSDSLDTAGQQPQTAPSAGDWRGQIEKLDVAIGQALERVPVPSGLADRLLAAVRASSESTETLAADAAVVPVEDAVDGPRWLRKPTRRWLLGSTAGLAAAACLAWVVLKLPASDESLGPEIIMQRAGEFALDAGQGWRPVLDRKPPQRFAPPSNVTLAGPFEWHPIEGGFLGRKGVVYELTSPSGARATLLVLALKGRSAAPRLVGLASSPRTFLSTAGRTSTVWTDGERVFALVVHGGRDDYRSFFRQPALA